MDLHEIIAKRFSVRNYIDKKVEKEKIDYILDCARLAPSACNRQPWTIYVASSPDVLANLKLAYAREWMDKVSTIIVVSAHHDQSWHRERFDNKDHSDVDLAILADHIILAATQCGLGSCWVCAFDPDLCRKALNIDDAQEEPVVMIPIGYADSSVAVPEKKRKNISDIVVLK
ncbi:MAG: nitroreductase family protein [Paludibacteraceae bacterium]|jgi:nitroreductase|nr:nitroreductase family protein [Paludibacteraceae bacterium]MBR6104917.1 nitroreductase family protein [Paludibacteraceae bacterium]